MRAHGNLAIALGSIGHFDGARDNALTACQIRRRDRAGWRHADAYDVLAIVEIAADRPVSALQALDDAHAALGDLEQPTPATSSPVIARSPSRCSVAHRPRSSGSRRPTSSVRSSSRSTRSTSRISSRRARAPSSRPGARARRSTPRRPHAERLPDAFVTGSLNLVIARCALALGDGETARVAVERAALSGDRHGWVFPDRTPSDSCGRWR